MKYLLSLFAFVFISCHTNVQPDIRSDDPETENRSIDNLILGCWTDPVYDQDIVTYSRIDAMPEDQYAFAFRENAKFEENKNVGWCGTPPITYGIFDGNWEIEDSLVTVSVEFWGGTAHYEWKILSVDDKSMTLEVLNTEFDYVN